MICIYASQYDVTYLNRYNQRFCNREVILLVYEIELYLTSSSSLFPFLFYQCLMKTNGEQLRSKLLASSMLKLDMPELVESRDCMQLQEAV